MSEDELSENKTALSLVDTHTSAASAELICSSGFVSDWCVMDLFSQTVIQTSPPINTTQKTHPVQTVCQLFVSQLHVSQGELWE